MKTIDWILEKHPGIIDEYDDRFEIRHNSGEHSTIWKNKSTKIIEGLSKLGDLYIKYDGMDLFSSTFKLFAKESPKSVEGVVLVGSLEEFNKYVSTMNPKFPEESIPFMYQAGIGIYAVGVRSGRIYEWDTEELELSGDYGSLDEIFEEWLDATS
ncbi:hypothetical protein [Methylobacter sp. BBA5.1]|jgi:hypothetical protein|uniref:hypothetical protein n=1 Tax=Methylobacter sp. BBA5.1 TaxID=1495064 RepID=UPI00055C87AF|nr:hypothetical protein [Methylobacter sp. BBA5.1]